MTCKGGMKGENKGERDKERQPVDQRKRKTCDDGRRRGRHGGREVVNWISEAVLQCDTSAFWESSATNTAAPTIKHDQTRAHVQASNMQTTRKSALSTLLRESAKIARGVIYCSGGETKQLQHVQEMATDICLQTPQQEQEGCVVVPGIQQKAPVHFWEVGDRWKPLLSETNSALTEGKAHNLTLTGRINKTFTATGIKLVNARW